MITSPFLVSLPGMSEPQRYAISFLICMIANSGIRGRQLRLAACYGMPDNLRGAALEDFIRDAAAPYWHQTCSAKMGRDWMSVVDAQLRVYGIENLRIADGSIMPRVTTGNTMAPCIIIGERAAEALRNEQRLETS
jgi:choline dehydrogenase-like flavoprotein